MRVQFFPTNDRSTFHEMATSYITQRVRDLVKDLRAARVSYQRGKLALDEYLAIRTSLRQAIAELGAALQKIDAGP